MTTQQITERKNEELQQQGGQHVEPNLAVHGQRSIVSYARRCGRLDGRLERAWKQYASQYLLQLGSDPSSLTVAPDQQIDQEYLAQVYGRVAPLTVEIGSGQGENIVAAAAAHPEQNFLALEVYEPGLAHTMLLAGKQGLTNLKVARTDAPEFFAAAQACISEVWTFFPDPWPKMKHHKRRLVQASLAENISHALLENSVWRIATDIDDYALHVHEVMDHNDRFVNIGDQEVSLPIEHVGKGTVDQAQYLPHAFFKESERFTGRVLTNFERKGLAAGHTIHDFTYRVLKNSD